MHDLPHFEIWWILVTLWYFDHSSIVWHFDDMILDFGYEAVPMIHLVYYPQDFYGHGILQDTRFECLSTLFSISMIFESFFLCVDIWEQFCGLRCSLDSLRTLQGWSSDPAGDRWFLCICAWHIQDCQAFSVLDMQPTQLLLGFSLIDFGFTSMNTYILSSSFSKQWVL